MATVFRPGSVQGKSGWAISNPNTVRHRVWGLAALLAFVFLGLLARLWYLQVAQGASYLAQAQRNRVRRVPLPAPRGLIVDRNGKVLATSRAAHAIAIVPAALPSKKREPKEREKVLRTLAYVLKISPHEIEQTLDKASSEGRNNYDPVRVADSADLHTITLVEENKPRLGPAVLVTDEITRNYPNGSAAAHILGYTGPVNDRDLERAKKLEAEDPKARKLRFDDTIGVAGVEREYDRLLAGQAGSAVYEVDSRLRPVRQLETIAEKPGNTLTLAIDLKLQKAAEQALGSARNFGAAVAIDVRNGEVLALASNPSYDPNVFSLSRRDPLRQSELKRLLENNVPAKKKKKYFFNRATLSHYAPGSTFKMMTAAAGLQKGAITPSTVFVCKGGLRLGRFFGCWKTHGAVNLYSAIAGSCDVYFYQTALRLGNPESTGPTYLAHVAREFGLGSKTGIDIPSDGAGLIPDPAWRRAVNKTRPDLAHWYPGNTLNMSIGQGDVLTTPLQMAIATAAVANGGTVWTPHVMKEVRDINRKIVARAKPKGKKMDIEQRYLADIRKGMRDVVTNGTGRSVAMTQVEVAGKTGSAEDDNHGLPHAWWVCFAPYKNPRIAIAVIIENAGHGSENAAPVAKKILEAAFPMPQKTARAR